VGAAHLTCSAAVRAGAGIVTLAAPRWLRDTLAPRLAEVTYLPLPDAGPVGNASACVAAIAAEIDRYDALAIGPGLSGEGEVTSFVGQVAQLAAERALPMGIDADALNALARTPNWQTLVGPMSILTPHPGELGRLTGSGVAPEPPWSLAEQLAREWGVTLIAKGAITAIGSAQGTWVHARPNPALATGGTGDVLTGIVGGLLARGLEPAAAARLGVWVHGTAGSLAATGVPAGGLAASDLLPCVPAAMAQTLVRPGTRPR
jgi:NAD(P)H-hydrate epimerase